MSDYYYIEEWKTNPMKQYLDTNIKIGDYVKIGTVEGFWVFVINVLKDNKYSGIISNHIVTKQPYNIDDKVIFEKKHIFDYKKSSTAYVSPVDLVVFN
jgi:hypothetical protein